MELIDVVIPAAGIGARLNKETPKQFILLGGVPVMVHPLRLFATIPWIGQKIIIHSPDSEHRLSNLLEEYGITGCRLIPGGGTRQESMRCGLAAVQTARVITHNAVVALVSRRLVEQVAAIDADCVTTANPVQENLVRGGDFAESPLRRDNLRIVVSPQCFRTEVLRECHDRAQRDSVTVASDAELMLHYGKTVRLVPGTVRNFKITTPLDLALAETLLARPDFYPE